MQKIEIFIACRSLTLKEYSKKCDPYVIMYIKTINQEQQIEQWTEYFRTEILKDNINPNFIKSCITDYVFEQQQHVKFQVFDNQNPSKQIFLGECQTTISKIAGSINCTLIQDLKNAQGKYSGKIILRVDKVAICNDELTFTISGCDIKDTRFWKFWTKTSPFLILFRPTEAQFNIKVHQTEPIENNLNPQFKEICVKSQKLCNGDYNMPILVECWDHIDGEQSEYIGSTQFSVNEVLNSKNFKKAKFQLKDKENTNVGYLKFTKFQLKQKAQFLDYIKGGTQLNLICAIDFTASNGEPQSENSLHAINKDGKLNQYQQAIYSVGDILLNYDSDKKVPLYGFGAKPKMHYNKNNQTLHCFPLNGNLECPEVFGINGMMEAYKQFLNKVDLAGPTLFNPLIQETMKLIENNCEDNNYRNYFILLILTDGQIQDMSYTVASIVKASRLPLSIIIVGLGDEDFTNMKILDGDSGLVDSDGNMAERDLVQFVRFNKYKNNPAALAQKVLEELPDQVVDFFTLVGVQPNEVQLVQMNEIQVNNIPQANENIGGFLIKGNFLQNIINQQSKIVNNEQQQINLINFDVNQKSNFNQNKDDDQQFSYDNQIAPPPPAIS